MCSGLWGASDQLRRAAPAHPRPLHAHASVLTSLPRRSQPSLQFDPLWNSMVIAGVDQATGESFLGTTSMIGVAYSDSHVATGFGNHLARPLFRNEQRDDMSESEARALLEKALKVCYYRDKNSINKFLIGTVTKEGTTLSAPFSLATEWGYGAFVHPTRHAIGSW